MEIVVLVAVACVVSGGALIADAFRRTRRFAEANERRRRTMVLDPPPTPRGKDIPL